MSDKSTQSEQAAELLRLADQIANWSEEHLRKKNPERYSWLRMQLNALRQLAEQTPEQAGAALLGAKVVWEMLYEDAWSGFGKRGGRKDHPYLGEVSVVQVVEAYNAVREDNPDISKTKAAPKIAEALGCSERTVWSRFGEAKI